MFPRSSDANEKLSPGWGSGYRQPGMYRDRERGPCARHGQHTGPLHGKCPCHRNIPSYTLTFVPLTRRPHGFLIAQRPARREGPGMASRRGLSGAVSALPPLCAARTGAQANAGMLLGSRAPTRSRAGRELRTGAAGPGGHYLSDGVSEEQHARPAQQPPAGSRLRQRHGRGRTSAGSGGGGREEEGEGRRREKQGGGGRAASSAAQTGRTAGRPPHKPGSASSPAHSFIAPFKGSVPQGGRARGASPHTPLAGWRRFQKNVPNFMVFIPFKETLPS